MKPRGFFYWLGRAVQWWRDRLGPGDRAAVEEMADHMIEAQQAALDSAWDAGYAQGYLDGQADGGGIPVEVVWDDGRPRRD